MCECEGLPIRFVTNCGQSNEGNNVMCLLPCQFVGQFRRWFAQSWGHSRSALRTVLFDDTRRRPGGDRFRPRRICGLHQGCPARNEGEWIPEFRKSGRILGRTIRLWRKEVIQHSCLRHSSHEST